MPDRVKLPCPALAAAALAFVIPAAGCPWREALTPQQTTVPLTAADGGALDDASLQQAIVPAAPSACPMLVDGDVTIHDVTVHLWVSDAPPAGGGPLVVYWHGTGSAPVLEANQFLGQDAIADFVAKGGMVASPAGTTGEGDATSTGTWTTGDYAIIDDLVGCAVAQGMVDPQRIFTAGCDSGGIEAGALAYARSNYVAAVSMNSGGMVGVVGHDGSPLPPIALQDPERIPAALSTHGPQGYDVVIVDFSDASIRYDHDVVSRGGFAVDCPHDRGHCAASQAFIKAQWEFFKDHAYGVDPEPYASGLPSDFPDECHVVDN